MHSILKDLYEIHRIVYRLLIYYGISKLKTMSKWYLFYQSYESFYLLSLSSLKQVRIYKDKAILMDYNLLKYSYPFKCYIKFFLYTMLLVY